MSIMEKQRAGPVLAPGRSVLRLSSTRRWCSEMNQLWQALGAI